MRQLISHLTGILKSAIADGQVTYVLRANQDAVICVVVAGKGGLEDRNCTAQLMMELYGVLRYLIPPACLTQIPAASRKNFHKKMVVLPLRGVLCSGGGWQSSSPMAVAPSRSQRDSACSLHLWLAGQFTVQESEVRPMIDRLWWLLLDSFCRGAHAYLCILRAGMPRLSC